MINYDLTEDCDVIIEVVEVNGFAILGEGGGFMTILLVIL